MFSYASLTRTFGNVLQSRIGLRRKKIVTSPTSRTAAAVALVVEALEQRTLFSATFDPGDTFATALNIGDLNGQQSFNGALNISNLEDFYKFTMPRGGMFSARFRTNSIGQQIELFHEQLDANGKPQEIQVDSQPTTQDVPSDGFAGGDLSSRFLNAGTYYIEVSERGVDTPYFLAMTADYAGDSLKNARNIGSATDATFQDFIGANPSPSLDDPVDIYKVKMDAPGQLAARLSLDNTNPNAVKAFVQLIHDANGNGVIDAGDILLSATPGTVTLTSLKVPAGTYFVRAGIGFNASNYHLNINADYAGTTPGTQRVMGSLDSIKSFNDFISTTGDPTDNYLFNVGSTRPLFLALSETGGGSSRLSLYKDANNDGVPQDSEFVVFNTANPFAPILTTIGAGHYIVQVQALSGSGTYTLAAETRPDAAGNTLQTAKNLGTINGLTHLDDYVSDVDPTDFYKFTASANGKVSASLFTEFGGDADLALIRDTNNNGVVDKNETLAAATLTSTGAKEFSKSITAGNYFLRVTHKAPIMTSKYFLSFQTDYAGSTPKTARNVGLLSGTRAFDDWASGPFGGAISDTDDIYKFNLTSTKTLTAKMTGMLSGQDLDLQLYRDKNNDGVLTANELVASSSHLNSPNEQITKSLTAGTYFLRVAGLNGETNYHLTLKA